MAVIYASARARTADGNTRPWLFQEEWMPLAELTNTKCIRISIARSSFFQWPCIGRRATACTVHARASAAHENLHTRPMKEWSRPWGVVVVVVTECPKNSDVCLLYTAAAAVCLEILTAKRTRYMITFRARKKNRETAADTYVPGRRKWKREKTGAYKKKNK